MKVDGLIQEIIFGPVESRRYGSSLGVNPLPADIKLCNFNCPYCECGWTDVPASRVADPAVFPTADQIIFALQHSLEKAKAVDLKIDNITFAGNGEPTMHPQFAELIDRSIALRDQLMPGAGLVVLSNSTLLDRPEIVSALSKLDEQVCKLDAGTQGFFRQIALPISPMDIDAICAGIKTLPNVVIQSMFVSGRLNNTGEDEIEAWIERLVEIQPKRVQVYSIERNTPDPRLEPVGQEMLEKIAENVRIKTGFKVETFV